MYPFLPQMGTDFPRPTKLFIPPFRVGQLKFSSRPCLAPVSRRYVSICAEWMPFSVSMLFHFDDDVDACADNLGDHRIVNHQPACMASPGPLMFGNFPYHVLIL